MNKLILICSMLMLSITKLSAQEVDYDKTTGMVQVEGKDAFYLVSKNKKLMISDYSLQNMEHKELAYLKYTDYGGSSGYFMVFTHTGNQCSITGLGTFANAKQVAKIIAAANLVQKNEMSEEEERKFIILHNGTFISTPAPAEKIIIANDSRNTTTQPADISIKEDKIYNNSELVGFFKSTKEEGNTIISVYNNSDALICKASHADGNNNADWNLSLDGKTVTLLYNTSAPMERLFKYLAEKGYL